MGLLIGAIALFIFLGYFERVGNKQVKLHEELAEVMFRHNMGLQERLQLQQNLNLAKIASAVHFIKMVVASGFVIYLMDSTGLAFWN